jgi:Glyoxalase/Bleomycin resistance protein/Dioxygenase superfamily
MLFGPAVQIAYVVDDPVAAAHRWVRDFGAGPFYVNQHIPVSNVIHRGKPSAFDHTSAYGWWGSMMIELFCQHNPDPTAVTERFAPGTGGLHHLACIVPSLDEALANAAAAGKEVAQSAQAGSTTFVFVDDVAECGHYWELYEKSPGLLGFYAMIRTAHENWDGTDPVRIIQR